MNTYEILVINEYGHIIHHHCFDSLSREEAEENAKKSCKHFGGCEWKVLKLK